VTERNERGDAGSFGRRVAREREDSALLERAVFGGGPAERHRVAPGERAHLRQNRSDPLAAHGVEHNEAWLDPAAHVGDRVDRGVGAEVVEFTRQPADIRELAVENDDRTFGVCDVPRLSERRTRPVVWDALHHRCYDPDAIPDREALALALATWPSGVAPKVHYASPKTAIEERRKRVGRRVERSLVLRELRARADLIDQISFEHFIGETGRGMNFDMMLEAKAKDVGLLRLREQLADQTGGEA
jgi:hypothetical protein